MSYHSGERLVAVFRTQDDAVEAAEAAGRAVDHDGPVRVGDPLDRVAALSGEMREELDHTIAGPGNVGPFTEEMSKGMSVGVLAGGLIGLVLALPFAAIDFGGMAAWTRLLVVALAGALAGGTAGWVIGGGFGAKRDDEALAAEHGVTVSVPASVPAERALVASRPVRVDLVDAEGRAIRTLFSQPTEPVLRTLGRHAANEDREG